MRGNKAQFSWALYDFANSSFTTLVVTFVYATYFTKAIAPDQITGTVLWSRAVTISALVVALFAPILGIRADHGYRKRYLFICTAVAIVSTLMLYRPLPGQVMQALCWFTIGNIAFEMGNIFYNAFLPDITTPEKIGRISGVAWGLGYLGGLAAMSVAMMGFINPEIPWFGLSKELGQNIRATNILVAAWFTLFSLPMFLFVKEKKAAPLTESAPWTGVFHELSATFRDIRKYRQIIRLLVAHLIYNDGLITIFAFGGIYAAGTFGFSFQEIMVFGIVLNITAGAGAFAFGFLDDRLGGKFTILVSLAGLIGASVLALITTDKSMFWLAGIMVGIFSGPNQSASRSLMARMIPADQESQFFGFFAFSGKCTAFLGPLLLGLLTEAFHSQRAGMTTVLVFFATGAIMLTAVDEQKGIQTAGRQKTA